MNTFQAVKRCFYIVAFSVCFFSAPVSANSFSFSEYEASEKQEEQTEIAVEQQKIADLMDITCHDSLIDKKVVVIIGDSDRQEKFHSTKSDKDILFQQINKKLQEIGLKTYSQAEITKLIAQAEMDAFLENDMDAAANAASKFNADFILRSVIKSSSRRNVVTGVNEVSVSMLFSLMNYEGKVISTVSADGESYAGNNPLKAASDIVQKRAATVVAQLYNDFCEKTKPRSQTTFKEKVDAKKNNELNSF